MNLPTPDPNAQAHSDKLIQFIRQEISASGSPISFARFMELALYAPGLGYYSAGQHKLGKAGDFVTAPEISPLFSQCVALQCQEILSELEGGDILEIGAGSGIFAKDCLLHLEQLNSLPQHYFILEISADLRQRQLALLTEHCPHLLSRIIWLDTLPTSFEGVIVGNEVMDALPVHCFKVEKSGIQEKCVSWQNDYFIWQLTPPSSELSQQINLILQEYPLSEGYESEINLLLSSWIQSLLQSLKRGIVLLFDYGYGGAEYYHPQRSMGTLMCYYQHHKHSDPFKWVGLQDMTAHVDFTRVVESAYAAGGALAGYTNQANFLLHCGIINLVQNNKNRNIIAQNKAAYELKKLTLPSEMGELIKTIALSKDYSKPLCGFPLPDQRRYL